jgi:hypothetical protein
MTIPCCVLSLIAYIFGSISLNVVIILAGLSFISVSLKAGHYKKREKVEGNINFWASSFKFTKVSASCFILGLILLTVSFSMLFKPELFGTYEECVLNKMSKQPSSMRMYAVKLCKKKYKVEEQIHYSSDKVGVEFSKEKSKITLHIVSNESEYNITEGKFLFSTKSCRESNKEDFIFSKKVQFKDKKATFLLSELEKKEGSYFLSEKEFIKILKSKMVSHTKPKTGPLSLLERDFEGTLYDYHNYNDLNWEEKAAIRELYESTFLIANGVNCMKKDYLFGTYK